MRVSVSAYIPGYGTHVYCYGDPNAAHEDVLSGIRRLRSEFGTPTMTSHGTKKRQRICWDFKGGARIVKTIQ